MYKKRSINFIIGSIVTLVITLVMLSSLAYYYFQTKNKLLNSLENDSSLTIERLQWSIAPFITSYSVNEYEKLIESELKKETIFAITVDDYLTGEILGEKFITGKTRDKNWKVISYSSKNELDDKKYLVSESFIKKDDRKIGKIKVYYSYKFLNEELNTFIKNGLAITLLIFFVLTIFLLLGIKKYVLNPISSIVNNISTTDSHGIPINTFSNQESLELSILNDKLNEMVEQIKKSKKKIDELNERFELSLSGVNDGIWDWNLETDKAYFSKRWKSMLGYEEDEIENCGKAFFKLIHNDDKSKVEVALKKHFENPEENQYNIQIRLKSKSGEYLWVLSRGKVILGSSRKPVRMLGFHSDITEAKIKEKQIKEYVKLVDKNIITSSTDLGGNITYVSEAFRKISGYSKEELIGKNHRIIRHPDMPAEVFKNIWHTITHNETWTGEIKNVAKDGSFYWVNASISPIFDQEGKKTGYTAIRQDITDKKLIEEISITDGLTNIYNRRHFNEIFPKVLNSAKREDELVSFIIMDIDHFKQYNDTYGHQMGDDVLVKVAKCIKDSLKRADDYCFRLGGEEFGIIFKVDNKEKAKQFANVIRENIENLHIQHSGNSASLYITVSIGIISEYAKNIKNYNEIYKQADDLLYKSKQTGRNKVSINS